MNETRARGGRRRPRRGSVEHPLDTRLLRGSLIVVALACLVAAVTITRPGALARPDLPPAFDVASASQLAVELDRDYPNRAPGTQGAADAARWMRSTLALYGLKAMPDEWRAEVPGHGKVPLVNVAAVVPGPAAGSIVVVASRDTASGGRWGNASGTGALIELARGYAPAGEDDEAVRPQHTIVFLSTDAGEYGSLGAARFLASSPLAHDVRAVIVLDDPGGPGPVRLDWSGDAPRSPAPALVRTAAERIRDETGQEPSQPGVLAQLATLAVPLGLGDQAPFLGADTSAIRIGARGPRGVERGEAVASIDRFARVGRAAQSLLASYDAGVELAREAPSSVFVGERIVRGWALQLCLLAALLPFAVGVTDLTVRCRRLGIRLAPGFRSLRRNLGIIVWGLLLLWVARWLGLVPHGTDRPLPPELPAATSFRLVPCLLILAVGVAGVLLLRRREDATAPTREELLGGHASALLGLGIVGAVAAFTNPFLLAFLLPSLYAWLWLPLISPSRTWLRDFVYAVGVIAPAAALVGLAAVHDLGVDVVPYLAGVVTSGYIAFGTVAVVAGWIAVALQLAAVTRESYTPYAGGVSPPPPGPVRGSLGFLLRRAHTRRRNGTVAPSTRGADPART